MSKDKSTYKTTVDHGIIVPAAQEEDLVPEVVAESVDQLITKEIEHTKLIVGDEYDRALLTEGTCIIASKPKVGKSYFAMTMALAVAGGHDFLGYKTHQCGVLYFDYETNEYTRQRRLKNILEANNWDPPGEDMMVSSVKARIGHGFEDMLAGYLEEHPNTNLVIIDMYQQIVDEKKSSRENDYEQAYRNFDLLNELARWYRIALVLVMHSRKEVNQDDPFSNILGSVGLQGATDQMLTLGRKGLDGPIRVWGKAKTHDSSPMLTMTHEKSLWKVVDNSEWDGYSAQADDREEYAGSPIRSVVIKLVKEQTSWKGRARELLDAAAEVGIALDRSPKEIGLFLHRYKGMFSKEDNVMVNIIKNGSGGSTYEIRDGSVPDGFEQIDTELVPF